MPGTPPASPYVAAPRYADTDTADFAADVNAITDAFDAYIGAMGQPPVGAVIAWAGSGDPPAGAGGTWVISDGRLVSTTTYPKFVTASPGNVYNGGVSPGSNLIRLPDRRGVKGVGAINMGSAAGAGANDNAHIQAAVGASGGVVTYLLQAAESGVNGLGATGIENTPHSHQISMRMSNGQTAAGPDPGVVSIGGEDIAHTYPGGGVGYGGGISTESANHEHPLTAAPATNAHTNVDPYQADSYIVRIA
jgi:hypothetical protein